MNTLLHAQPAGILIEMLEYADSALRKAGEELVELQKLNEDLVERNVDLRDEVDRISKRPDRITPGLRAEIEELKDQLFDLRELIATCDNPVGVAMIYLVKSIPPSCNDDSGVPTWDKVASIKKLKAGHLGLDLRTAKGLVERAIEIKKQEESHDSAVHV